MYTRVGVSPHTQLGCTVGSQKSMELLENPYFSGETVKIKRADLDPPTKLISSDTREERTKSSTSLHDADDSGFSECCTAVEYQEQPRFGGRKSKRNEFPPEVVHWTIPLRGSSTPSRIESSTGSDPCLNVGQSSFGMKTGTEVIEIDLRRKYGGLTSQKDAPSCTSQDPVCLNSRPWCIEAPCAESRFDHCLSNRRIPCLTETPSQNHDSCDESSFVKQKQKFVRREHDPFGGSLALCGWQNQFFCGKSGPKEDPLPVMKQEDRLYVMKQKYLKRLTGIIPDKVSIHDETITQQSTKGHYTSQVRVTAPFTKTSLERCQQNPPRLYKGENQTCKVDDNNNLSENTETTEVPNLTPSPDSELDHQALTIGYSFNTLDRDTKIDNIANCTYLPNTYLTVPNESVQIDPHARMGPPLAEVEPIILESYSNVYSDVSEEEPESLTVRQREGQPSDGTDTDSTAEPVSPPYCPFSDIALKFDHEERPKLRKRVSRRKMSIPRRSAEKQDPRFRGVTMWLQTEFKNGQSNLHISAFYSNVKPSSPTTTYHPPCQPVLTSPEQYSCSDAEGNSPHHCVKICASCRTRRTPLWRDAEDGTPLCNACGIRYKKYRLRCSKCWHIPKKEIKTYPNCPICGASLRYSFASRKTW